MSEDTTPLPSPRGRIRALFSGRKGAVLSVALVVWGLTLFDLTLLPRVSTRYLLVLAPQRLIGVSVQPSATVMTSADPTSPAGPWVLTRRGGDVEVIGTYLPNGHTPRRPRTRLFRVRLRTIVRHIGRATPIAVDGWRKAEPALFTVSSARRGPIVGVYSLQGANRRLLESRVELPPQTTDRRNFFIAKWSGPLPDLFVVDRNAERHPPKLQPSPRPWSIRIYSGESGFKRLIEHTQIRPKLSRRLSKYDWWLSVGRRHRTRPSLVLVTREPKTGSGRTEIHILSGRSRFHVFSIHAATALPQRVGLKRPFVFQSGPRGDTVMMVRIDRGRLTLSLIPLP